MDARFSCSCVLRSACFMLNLWASQRESMFFLFLVPVSGGPPLLYWSADLRETKNHDPVKESTEQVAVLVLRGASGVAGWFVRAVFFLISFSPTG